MSGRGFNLDEQSYIEKAIALLESYARSDLFTGAALIAHGGQPLVRKAFGLAIREWAIANVPEVKFRIASVTKQFTAAAILLLAERGKLELDDFVSKYYAEAPVAWREITIRHLLTHTSGIPNYTSLPDFHRELSKIDHTPLEIVQWTRDAPLQFEPSRQFAYSNSGYILLGHIIETTTGQSYSDYLQENIFTPLGMLQTGYDDQTVVVANRASGYRFSNGRWENAAHIAMSLSFSAGALYSTIDDLLIWDLALSEGKLLTPASLQAMFRDHGHGYGFGWVVQEQFDRCFQTHGGSINGFCATIDRYPECELAIILLSNLENSPVEKIARELAALRFSLAEVPTEALVDPVLLGGYVGNYKLAPNFMITISRDGDRLFAQATKQENIEIFPESDRVFYYKIIDAQISFEVDPRGRTTGLMLRQNGKDLRGERTHATEAKQIAEPCQTERRAGVVDPELFDGYVGHYELAPNFILTISREGDRLFSKATGQPKVEIYPAGDRDYFLKGADAQISFEGDYQGRATRLVLHQGGRQTIAERIV